MLTTFDPDEMISANGLGIAAKEGSDLISGCKMLVESPDLWRKLSTNARQFYLDNYVVDQVMLQYEKWFTET